MQTRIQIKHVLLGLLFLATSIARADTLLWSDSFETYAPGSFPTDGGWFIRPGAPGVGSSSQFVSTNRAFSGTQSLRLEGAEGLGINVERQIALPGTRFAFEAMANTTRLDSRSVLVGVGTQDEVYAAVQFRHNGVVAARSGYGYTTLPVTFAPDTWYRLKVVVDTAAADFDVYVNDVLVGQALPIYPLPQPIDKVLLNVDNNGFGPDGPGFAPGGTVSYFDDAKFFDLSATTDDDGDSVPNEEDQCASTPNGEIIDPVNGCSLAQLVPCGGPAGGTAVWRNHGKYVSAAAHVSTEFLNRGLITAAQRDAIMSAAGASVCPP